MYKDGLGLHVKLIGVKSDSGVPPHGFMLLLGAGGEGRVWPDQSSSCVVVTGACAFWQKVADLRNRGPEKLSDCARGAGHPFSTPSSLLPYSFPLVRFVSVWRVK